MADRRGAYRVWWGDLRERDHLDNVDVGESIIVHWTFKSQVGVID
jgi:hypothetical protein